jgi:hypothetical protein
MEVCANEKNCCGKLFADIAVSSLLHGHMRVVIGENTRAHQFRVLHTQGKSI